MKYLGLLFLLLPIAGQVYISWHLWRMLPALLPLRIAVVTLITLAFLAIFLSFSGINDRVPMGLATCIYEVGTSWIMILLYLVMLYLLLDLGGLVHLVPKSFMHASWAGSITVAVLMTGIFTYGYVHYNHKVRVPLDLTTTKHLDRPMRLVMISDVHLGYHNRRAHLHRWLQLIAREKPDAVLIAGDLIDGSIRPVAQEKMAEEFRALKMPVYAIYGNHNYYTGLRPDREFCQQAGITLLQDSVAYLGDVAIVGRDDRTNVGRHTLQQVMAGIDRSKYIIEMDHQPYHLEEAERCGVDLEFAGHTHYGQVWPISWIVDAIYEDGFGPYQRGNTRYYVSSGLGIWGGKFRIGTRSEYVVATLHN